MEHTTDLHERLVHLPIQANPALVEHAEQRAQNVQNRIADRITTFAGSMRFVYIHIAWFGLWIGLGVEKYPFGLLTMIVSLEAIFLSTFVMIAQNRLSALADLRAQADYEVNVRAEAEVAKILALVQSLVEHHVESEAPPVK